MISFEYFKQILPSIHEACIKAGDLQKRHHKTNLQISTKSNKTPVTQIDIDSNIIISESLSELTPEIPIISEEDYEGKSKNDSFWIVDPLDGTRDYLDNGDNFCICISLIDETYPILGIIYSPMSGNFYYAYKNEGAYLIRRENSPIRIMTKKVSDSDEIQIFTSIAINKNILQQISGKIKNVLFTPLSSALKFGAIASGEGSFYPRLGPTHEWDTAAGQCLIEEAGGIVVDRNMNRLKYNKNSNFLNEEFFVIGDPSYDWKSVIDSIICARKLTN